PQPLRPLLQLLQKAGFDRNAGALTLRGSADFRVAGSKNFVTADRLRLLAYFLCHRRSRLRQHPTTAETRRIDGYHQCAKLAPRVHITVHLWNMRPERHAVKWS